MLPCSFGHCADWQELVLSRSAMGTKQSDLSCLKKNSIWEEGKKKGTTTMSFAGAAGLSNFSLDPPPRFKVGPCPKRVQGKPFVENNQVIPLGAVGLFANFNSHQFGNLTAVSVPGHKQGPFNAIRYVGGPTLVIVAATLTVSSPCAHNMRAQIVFVPESKRAGPNVINGLTRTLTPAGSTSHSRSRIVLSTTGNFQYISGSGHFEIRFCHDVEGQDAKCWARIENDSSIFTVQQIALPVTLPVTTIQV